MRRLLLSIAALAFVFATPGPGQDREPAPERSPAPYTYARGDYDAALAAAEGAEQRREVLETRWKAIRLAAAHAHVVTDGAFHVSMQYWTSQWLSTGVWSVETEGDLARPVRRPGESTVLVRGDCLQPVHVTGGALIHVLGDLDAEINVEGQCEVLVGGDVKRGGRIVGDGIVRVFVGGDVHGAVRNAGSSTVWIAGSLAGEVATGTPSTKLHVMGDVSGAIAPAGEASLLQVEARGHVPWRVLAATAGRDYTEFEASVGSSDRPAGLYANRLATWVIHRQR